MKQQHYILQIDSYLGDTTSRQQDSWSRDSDDFHSSCTLYAIVSISDAGAVIVDDGYRSVEEAQSAWPEAIFERSVA